MARFFAQIAMEILGELCADMFVPGNPPRTKQMAQPTAHLTDTNHSLTDQVERFDFRPISPSRYPETTYKITIAHCPSELSN